MTAITVTGNLTADPELRWTPSGAAVASFTVAENRGKDDKKETYFHRCQAWDEMAEMVAEHLRKGQRVIVTGDLRQSSYQTREGDKRTAWEITAWDVGASLKWKPKNGSSSSGGYDRSKGQHEQMTANEDPWANQGTATRSDDEPPF